MSKRLIILIIAVMYVGLLRSEILVPMDETQKNHLRAYGLVYNSLKDYTDKIEWLLNYRGGSFLIKDNEKIGTLASILGVSYEKISQAKIEEIEQEIKQENMQKVLLEKAPKVAVYKPPGTDPWDDAVVLALNYAKIEFDQIYDTDIILGNLSKYDWVHLHHEDFTGQFGKFYANFRNAPWYIKSVSENRALAKSLGFKSVQELKKTVAYKISEYVKQGGFLFAMCSAIDSLDVALSSLNIDIIAPEIDNTPIGPDYDKKLNFKNCFAFENFKLITNPYVYEFSNIDHSDYKNPPEKENFYLFDFSAKYDPIPTLLTQDHKRVIKGFFGQTTAFNLDVIKKKAIIMGKTLDDKYAKYIYGSYGKGFFSFLAGHDPEDAQHYVGDPPTDLNLHKNSPGYRLILNNILFPAAKQKKRKT